jgi:hypothetical protein
MERLRLLPAVIGERPPARATLATLAALSSKQHQQRRAHRLILRGTGAMDADQPGLSSSEAAHPQTL